MKITLNHRRFEQGAFLIVVFVVLVVLAIGGCTIYNVRKITKKWPENGGPPCTNTVDQDLLAPSQPQDVSFELLARWVEIETNSLRAASVPTVVPARVIVISFLPENPALPVLSMSNDVGWVKPDLSPWLDANGLPMVLSSNNYGRAVELYWSYDMNNWNLIATLRAETNQPALFRDTAPVQTVFYRAKAL